MDAVFRIIASLGLIGLFFFGITAVAFLASFIDESKATK